MDICALELLSTMVLSILTLDLIMWKPAVISLQDGATVQNWTLGLDCTLWAKWSKPRIQIKQKNDLQWEEIKVQTTSTILYTFFLTIHFNSYYVYMGFLLVLCFYVCVFFHFLQPSSFKWRCQLWMALCLHIGVRMCLFHLFSSFMEKPSDPFEGAWAFQTLATP